MAYTTINNSKLYQNTMLYTGDDGTRNITESGTFQADLVWLKRRNDTSNYYLTDSVRGATKDVSSNTAFAQDTHSTGVTGFVTDGFSLGGAGGFNNNGDTFVSWTWKANGAGSANTDGSISSTVSANTTSGFSIVSYTGTGANATIGHGLGSVPKMIIVKCLNQAKAWTVYHNALGAGKAIFLEQTATPTTSDAYFGGTTPTSSVFSVGSSTNVSDNSSNFIAYCFAEKTGYSKFGSFVGNGSADGCFIYTGFKPSFFMAKKTSAAGDPWVLIDNKRNPINALSNTLTPSDANAENTGTDRADFLSQGVKIRTTSGAWNASGATYIYMAFAEAPLVGSNNVPANAR